MELVGNVVPIGSATGPRSVAGKRRSAQNALKGGLYAGSTVLRHVESVEEYNAFARHVVADLGARSTLEVALAERLCSALWRGRRVRRFEAEKLSAAAEQANIIAMAASKVRLTADTIARYGQAVATLAGAGPVDATTVRTAALGFKTAYCPGTGAELQAAALHDALEYLARRDKPVASKAVRDAIVVANESMPLGIERDDVDGLIDSTADILRESARRIVIAADGKQTEARRAQADALLLDRHEGVRVDDAERRIDRQIARALADLQAARGLAAPRVVQSQLTETAS